jgi:hypothetical protein
MGTYIGSTKNVKIKKLSTKDNQPHKQQKSINFHICLSDGRNVGWALGVRWVGFGGYDNGNEVQSIQSV